MAESAVVQAAVAPAFGGGLCGQEDVVQGTGGFGALVFWVEEAAAGAQEVDADEVLEGFEFVSFALFGGLGVGYFLCRPASPFVPDVF